MTCSSRWRESDIKDCVDLINNSFIDGDESSGAVCLVLGGKSN